MGSTMTTRTISVVPFLAITCLQSICLRLWRMLVEIFRRRDHFKPHPDAAFEGYYTRVLLDNGGTVTVIFCWIKEALARPNLIHVSYTPPDEDSALLFPGFKHEVFPERLYVDDDGEKFTVGTVENGLMTLVGDSATYVIQFPSDDLFIRLDLTGRVPWSSDGWLAGPMGFIAAFAHLLPLNWHVYSTASSVYYGISQGNRQLEGQGVAHVEKNWGASFPRGWIWSQSFPRPDDWKSLCLAGGTALPGVQAYLVGYRSLLCHWDFRPPFSMSIFGLSPFMHVDHDSRAGTFALSVQTWMRKLVVRADAPPESCIGLACPLEGGHELMHAFESFQARIRVEAYTRYWPWQPWHLVESGTCGFNDKGDPSAALEFGGSYCHLVQVATKR